LLRWKPQGNAFGSRGTFTIASSSPLITGEEHELSRQTKLPVGATASGANAAEEDSKHGSEPIIGNKVGVTTSSLV
jgi:hypothetical protein